MVTAPGDGTAIAIELPRAVADGDTTVPGTTGVGPEQIGRVVLAGLVAGVAMGVVLQGATDALPAIGGLYGALMLAVGWIIHLFHSVAFVVVFAAGLTRPTGRRHTATLGGCVALGVGFGVALWASAAGVIMPVWLNAVGIPAPVPRLSLPSFLGHVVWGVLLGGLYGWLENQRESAHAPSSLTYSSATASS